MISISIAPAVYGNNLHATLFSAAGNDKGAILLITPFFEEKRCTHRALFTCAQSLANAGYTTLIPDLTGTGNSAGDLVEISLEHWHNDLRAATAVLPAGLPITIIGCRAGALLAVDLLHESTQIDRMILWHPVTAGKSYLRETVLRRMSQNSIVGGEKPQVGEFEIEGQLLSPELYLGMQALKMPEKPPHSNMRLLQCSFSEKILGEYARLGERWDDSLTINTIISKPFWQPHTPYAYADLATALLDEVTA
ncbi:MAG: alpha/beta hydrolase [bacterium]